MKACHVSWGGSPCKDDAQNYSKTKQKHPRLGEIPVLLS